MAVYTGSARGFAKNRSFVLLVGSLGGAGGVLCLMLYGGFDVLPSVCLVQNTKLFKCDST
jgi:hypothetical protein